MAIKAGTAKIIITPPVGVELAGYSFGPSQGILTDLEAQVLVLESLPTSGSAKETIAILTADLLTIGPRLAASVRQRAEVSFGIPASHILLAASHTHSGPATMPFRQWGAVNESYLHYLEEAMVGAIGIAQSDLHEARLGLGLGQVERISHNRRGRSEMVDPQVAVLVVEDISGQSLAVLFNFSSHPVTLHSYRGLITPDYPGYARQVIRDVIGKDTQAMFILGAAGDINPAGYIPNSFTPQRSRQIGAILGCEVAKIALDPQYQDDPVLRVVSATLDLPVEPLPEVAELQKMHRQLSEQVEGLQAEGASWEKIARVLIQRDWALDALDAWEGGSLQRTLPCEIMAVRLGDAVILAAPLELFAATGLAIKAASPAQATLICSNANGALGYLPTLDAYQEEDYTNPQGVAHKVYGLYAFSPQAEPIFRQEAIRMLQALYP